MNLDKEFFGCLLVSLISEWDQVGSDYNWRTFHPVMIEVEDDRMLGAAEATLTLLGFGVRVRWTYTETDELREIKRTVDDVKAGRAPVKEVDLSGGAP